LGERRSGNEGEGEGDKAAQVRSVVNDGLLNLHVFVSVAVY
jgi:hypothetical protein